MSEPALRTVDFRAGTVKVAIGLAAFGAATYAFTAVALRALGPTRFADFNVYWGLVYGVGLGLVLPFEQEASRRTAQAMAHGRSERSVVSSATVVAAVVAAGTAVLCGLLAIILLDGADAWALWGTTSLSVLGLSLVYVRRGAMSGRHAFGRYSAQLGSEGALRVLGALALWVAGTTSPWLFAAVVPLALGGAWALVRLPAQHGTDEPVRPAELANAVAPLLVASVISASLVNFGPVAVRYLPQHVDEKVAGGFLAAAFVARLPIFAFAAVQAVLIPRLVRSVAARDAADLRRGLLRVLVPTAALAVSGVLGVAALGPTILRLLAGAEYSLPRLDMVLLTAAVGTYLLTLALQPAAVAMGRHRPAALVWATGAVVFGSAWVLPLRPTMAVSVAIAAASLWVSAGLAIVVTTAARGLSGRSDDGPSPA